MAPVSNTSRTRFGAVQMIDNPLTETQDLPKSKLWGRAQGFYAAVAGGFTRPIWVVNGDEFSVCEWEIQWKLRHHIWKKPIYGESEREMPVIGGSGLFRFAREMPV